MEPRFRPRLRGPDLRWAAAAALTLLSSCGGDRPAPLQLVIEEISSPAEAVSGEPHLAAHDGGVILSWLETRGTSDGRENALIMDRWKEGRWAGRRTVARGGDLLVNWADFPSVVVAEDGTLAAHWLVRGGEGGYDYGIRVAFSRDGGETWSPPWTPHEDATPTEHGFVSLFPFPAGSASEFGLVWLDGRAFAEAEAGAAEEGDMALRFRAASMDGAPGPELVLDDRTCECCQTDVAITSEGPLVVYRDRSPDEVRDIYVLRRVSGAWEDPRPVHDDGWVFPACPVNGPAADARDQDVAVAWFTAAEDVPAVQLAFSDDGGASFSRPVKVDEGDPAGRVDVVLLQDGSALVSWIERADGAAEVRVRRVEPSGRRSAAASVAETGGGRSSGFPQMMAGPDGEVLFAWTDSRDVRSRVRVALARLEEPGRDAP